MFFTDSEGFVYQKKADFVYFRYMFKPVHAVILKPSLVELTCVIAAKDDKNTATEVEIRVDENNMSMNTTHDVRVTPAEVGQKFSYILQMDNEYLITEGSVLLPLHRRNATTKEGHVMMWCCIPKRICDIFSMPNTFVQKEIQYMMKPGDQLDVVQFEFKMQFVGEHTQYIDLKTGNQYTGSIFDPREPVITVERTQQNLQLLLTP